MFLAIINKMEIKPLRGDLFDCLQGFVNILFKKSNTLFEFLILDDLQI